MVKKETKRGEKRKGMRQQRQKQGRGGLDALENGRLMRHYHQHKSMEVERSGGAVVDPENTPFLTPPNPKDQWVVQGNTLEWKWKVSELSS